MPTADQIAHAVIVAAREMGADPIEAMTVRSAAGIASSHYQRCARSRIYAAHALRQVYGLTDINVALLLHVAPHTAPSWFGSIRKQWGAWFDAEVASRVTAEVSRFYLETTPKPAPPALPEKRPVGRPPKVLPIDRGPRRGLDKFAPSRPLDANAGGEMQLNRRATERRTLQDILAEAAANTRAMQDRMMKDADEGAQAED